MLTVNFMGTRCALVWNTYLRADGNVRLDLVGETTGEPIATATINPDEGIQLSREFIAVRDWGIYVDMPRALRSGGVIEQHSIGTVRAGNYRARVYKLTEAARLDSAAALAKRGGE